MLRSTFFGFEAAKTAVFANQKSLDIVGNNLANTETKGYTRQRVERASIYTTTYSSRIASSTIGQAGRGVETLGVSQIRDDFLDKCYRDEYSLASYYGKSSDILNDVLNVFPEAMDITDSSGFIGGINKLYESINKYIQEPTLDSEANIVKSAFLNMVQVIQRADQQLTTVAERQTMDLGTTIDRVNEVMNQIAHINKIIAGDATVVTDPSNEHFRPNELLDRRNLLLDELAGYGNINVISQADGTVDVEMGGKLVINQGECDALTMSKDQKGYVDVDWRSSGKSVSLTSGSLLGYINVLNGRGNNAQSNKETPVQGIPYYRDRINTFAAALVKVANTSIPENDGNGNPKVGADGKIEYKILLSAKKGDGTTDSSLPITAGNIAISDEWNLNGPGYFIFSRAENVENYAQKLSARLTGESNTFTSYGESFQGNFSDYIIDVVGKVGTDVSFNEGRRDAAATVSDDFLSQREAVSGVQQDEETADMLKYQRSYQAAARIMTVMDELLETLINRIGIAGR